MRLIHFEYDFTITKLLSETIFLIIHNEYDQSKDFKKHIIFSLII